MDRNIFKEKKASRTLLRYARFFMIVASLGKEEDKERHKYLGRLLSWKGKVIQRNEKRWKGRKRKGYINSSSECQILQFPSIKESA